MSQGVLQHTLSLLRSKNSDCPASNDATPFFLIRLLELSPLGWGELLGDTARDRQDWNMQHPVQQDQLRRAQQQHGHGTVSKKHMTLPPHREINISLLAVT